MKVRNGFVSNSSSSSFIIACKADPKIVVMDGDEVISTVGLDSICGSCKTIETLDQLHYIGKYEYYCKTPEEMAEDLGWYKGAVEAINEGKIVKIFAVENGNYEAEELLNKFKVIEYWG